MAVSPLLMSTAYQPSRLPRGEIENLQELLDDLNAIYGRLRPARRPSHCRRCSGSVATVVAIFLSHFAGSALAQLRRVRADRAANAEAARSTGLLHHLQAAQIKSTADTVKAVYEALTPVAAGGAAVWAAFNHISF